MSEFSVSEAALAIQEEVILRDYCPNSGNEENCAAFVPDFWRLIAQQLWPEAWSHLCDAKPCVEGGADFDCADCIGSLTMSLYYLRTDNIVNYWSDKLGDSFCSDNYPALEEVCQGHLQDVFPQLVDLFTDNAGNWRWIVEFCTVDMGCQN